MELKKRVDKPSSEFPENFKFKIMARNLENPSELVRLDNHLGKAPHYHIDNEQKYFTWVSWQETKKLFYQLACKRFGHFD